MTVQKSEPCRFFIEDEDLRLSPTVCKRPLHVPVGQACQSLLDEGKRAFRVDCLALARLLSEPGSEGQRRICHQRPSLEEAGQVLHNDAPGNHIDAEMVSNHGDENLGLTSLVENVSPEYRAMFNAKAGLCCCQNGCHLIARA